MRISSCSLSEFPLSVVRLNCERRGRGGRAKTAWWRGSRADIALPDLLVAVASCERRRDLSGPCGARFTDLANLKVHQHDRR
jgi:hypothetical protein